MHKLSVQRQKNLAALEQKKSFMDSYSFTSYMTAYTCEFKNLL